MPQSRPIMGSNVPNWYIGMEVPEVPYFGSTARMMPGQTFLTHDAKYIVTRNQSGVLTAMHNACAHAGGQILSTPGLQEAAPLRCPIHQWRYSDVGQLTHAPNFCNHEHISLARPLQGMWNGYLLGCDEHTLSEGLGMFGQSLGAAYRSAFCADEFVFLGEQVAPVPYPRQLMVINYQDGAHVPLAHPTTFASVADCESYAWEMGPTDTTISYSIQEVRAHRDVAEVARRALAKRKAQAQREGDVLLPSFDDLGWASLHLWLREELGDAPRPLERNVFALLAIIYPYILMELYEGGLILAVSHLVEHPTEAPSPTNAQNPIEFYVHKSVPPDMREELGVRFRRAYMQSAHEDDELCLSLYAAHRRGPMTFCRTYHNQYEAGDQHLAEWFLRFSV